MIEINEDIYHLIHSVLVNIKCNKIYMEPHLSSTAASKCNTESLEIINQAHEKLKTKNQQAIG